MKLSKPDKNSEPYKKSKPFTYSVKFNMLQSELTTYHALKIFRGHVSVRNDWVQTAFKKGTPLKIVYRGSPQRSEGKAAESDFMLVPFETVQDAVANPKKYQLTPANVFDSQFEGGRYFLYDFKWEPASVKQQTLI